MIKWITLLLLLIPLQVSAFLVTGKDGSTENVLNVNTSGQITTTAPAWDFEEVAASATDQTLGGDGEVGEYLHHCVCQGGGANGSCGIEDGSNTLFDDITVVPTTATAGVYTILVQAAATTSAGWEVTTGSAATMQCYGIFD